MMMYVHESPLQNGACAGVITPEHAPKYEEYKQRLRQKTEGAQPVAGPYSNATVIELQQHHGFGLAVKVALKHVLTPLVIVIQVRTQIATPESQLHSSDIYAQSLASYTSAALLYHFLALEDPASSTTTEMVTCCIEARIKA
jgi:hypothetical protein